VLEYVKVLGSDDVLLDSGSDQDVIPARRAREVRTGSRLGSGALVVATLARDRVAEHFHAL
jgi:hypothetical protein